MFESDSDFDVDEEFLGSIASSQIPPSSYCEKICEENQSFIPIVEQNRNTGRSELPAGTGNNISEHILHRERACVNNNVVERLFPGPAGLLPERRNAGSMPTPDSNRSDCSASENVQKRNKSHHMIQSWQGLLESSTWKKFLTEFEAQPKCKEILNNINIKQIKEKASARLLVCKKVPFLAAILHEVNLSSPDPYITLCDQTGVIGGALHRDAWKQFGDELVPSCVLILRNVGVLSLGINPHKNQHYLNITSRNMATLYTSQEGAIRITNINPFGDGEITESLKDWHSNTGQTGSPLRPSNQMPQHLFNSSVVSQSSILSDISPLRNFQFSPHINLKSPRPCTPLSRNNSLQENTARDVGPPFAQPSRRTQSPLFSPPQQTENPSNSRMQNTNLDVRDASTILNLMSKSNQNTSYIPPNSVNTLQNINVNNTCIPSVSNNSVHNSNVSRCRNLSSTIKLVDTPECNKSISTISLDAYSRDNRRCELNSSLDRSFNFQPSAVSRCQKESKGTFNFSPKRARTVSVENCVNKNDIRSMSDGNGKRLGVTKFNQERDCASVTNSDDNNSSYPKENDEQWEVETILSSIDAESFFEEDF